MRIFIFTLILMPVLLFIDSQWLAQDFKYGQGIANVLMILSFIWIYKQSSDKLKLLMKYGVVISFLGEVLFSLMLGMYEYRLENLPVYVPFGHAILYAAVYTVVEDKRVLQHSKIINISTLLFAVAYGLFWLYYDNDLYGFVCLIVLLAALHFIKPNLLFTMTMFVLVAYLEQLGTRLENWYWPEIAFGRFEWMPSGNPPSAIGIFYLVLDALCNWRYNRRIKSRNSSISWQVTNYLRRTKNRQ